MATKKTGISPELLIPPGETVADVLENRGMTRGELADKTGFSPAYIDAVIAAKEEISPDFADALERVFDVPKSFWMNLQANYNEELREVYAAHQGRNLKTVLTVLAAITKTLLGSVMMKRETSKNLTKGTGGA